MNTARQSRNRVGTMMKPQRRQKHRDETAETRKNAERKSPQAANNLGDCSAEKEARVNLRLPELFLLNCIEENGFGPGRDCVCGEGCPDCGGDWFGKPVRRDAKAGNGFSKVGQPR